MAVLRSALFSVIALVLLPRAAADEASTSCASAEEATPSCVLLQQQSRRQSTQGGMFSFLQNSGPNSNGQSSENTFHGLDANSDGILSRDEIASFATSQGLDAMSAKSELALLDTDGDGALSMSEFVGVMSTANAANALNSADVTASAAAAAATVTAPAALPPQGTLPAQTVLQQAPQAPTAMTSPGLVGGLTTQAAVSQAAAVPSVSMASTGIASSSSEFVNAQAKHLMESWTKFENDAKHVEAEAEALRAKAKEELRMAQELSGIAENMLMKAKQTSLHPAGAEAAAAGANTAEAAAAGASTSPVM
eukprot:CAMPEP_0115249008 /NCGR_PEP_ID=MMETSP0270-20121206/42366_1 /TAXON_ID=71861 /ORGANISM="Scrippsiella trochoidea, Strain CCMP3099" /LENGTH=307 /DNA_ID=CAMNT_0002664331 /DNA_START=95 /DNA_END=1018 /DNA_ORIENTATION=-